MKRLVGYWPRSRPRWPAVRAGAGHHRQDRRAQRHVEPLRRHRRPGLGRRRQDGDRRLHQGQPEGQGRTGLGRSPEQARRRLGIANQWFDVDKVDMIIDVPNSGVALAVSQVAGQKNKLFIVSGAAASDLTGPKCNANTIHWTYDTWMLANGTGKAMVKTGGDTWFFLTADYAFGHALERDTAAVVEANGGKVLGKVRASAQHAGLLLVPAAGADLEGEGHRACQRGRRHHQLDQAGVGVRHREGRAEARRPSGVLERRRTRSALPTANGLSLTETWYWDANDTNRAWTKRWQSRSRRRQVPDHDPCGRLCRHPALPEGARGARRQSGRQDHHRQDEGNADRRHPVRQGHHPGERPQGRTTPICSR